MLLHQFNTPYGELRSNWKAAFPDASLTGCGGKAQGNALLWVLLPVDAENPVETVNEAEVSKYLAEQRAAAGNLPFIVLSDIPSDEQGLLVLGLGAAGYCNGHAAPAVLQQVAATVESGGVWVGQSLLQRLMGRMANLAAQKITRPAPSDWASSLTEREVAVALAVAAGASNKEVASQLDITERTVKAHLVSIFEKLKLRDRLHLSLLANGIVKN